MAKRKDNVTSLKEKNIRINEKLTELYKRFHERETHLANMNQQMELHKKLYETQIKKLDVLYRSERDKWEKEKQIMLENLKKSEEMNGVLRENLDSLHTHVELYKSKFKDVEKVAEKSNKLLESFRTDMDKMQKTNNTLMKEKNEWHIRWQSANSSAIEISDLQQQTSQQLKLYERKIAMLEKLCRQLQADRSAFIEQLKDNNIVPVEVKPLEVSSTDNSPPVDNCLRVVQSAKELKATRRGSKLKTNSRVSKIKSMKNLLIGPVSKLANDQETLTTEKLVLSDEFCKDNPTTRAEPKTSCSISNLTPNEITESTQNSSRILDQSEMNILEDVTESTISTDSHLTKN